MGTESNKIVDHTNMIWLLYHQTISSMMIPTYFIRQHFITSSSSYLFTNHIWSSYCHLNPLWLITSIDQQLISLSPTSAYILMIRIKIRVEVTMTMMMTSLARLGESVGVSIRHALSRARDMAPACWLLQTTRSPTLLSRLSCYLVQMKTTLWAIDSQCEELSSHGLVLFSGEIVKDGDFAIRVANPWEWLTPECGGASTWGPPSRGNHRRG